MQDQFGLLERGLLTKVPQELKEPDVPWQIELADAAKHAQIGLQQGEQALRPVLMHLPPRVFLLRMIDKVMGIALERSIAAGGICVEPTTRLPREVRRLLHRLDREIAGRVDDDRALAADPGDDGWPVFLIVAPARLALLAAPTRAAAQRLFPAAVRLALLPSGVIEFIRFHGALQLTLHLRGERGMT